MKELVEVIAKALVDDPDSVVVTEREERKTWRSVWLIQIWERLSENRDVSPKQSAQS